MSWWRSSLSDPRPSRPACSPPLPATPCPSPRTAAPCPSPAPCTRICRVYATIGVLVPVFGLATAGSMHVMGDTWLIVSIILTAIAAAVLGLLVLPRQRTILACLDTAATTTTSKTGLTRHPTARLALHTGMFNLLWATITVLMIVRPGSTTGT